MSRVCSLLNILNHVLYFFLGSVCGWPLEIFFSSWKHSYNKNLFSVGSSYLQQGCLSDYYFSFYCIAGCKILLNLFLTMKLIYRHYFKHYFWIYICALFNCIFKQCCCLISWFSSHFLSLLAKICVLCWLILHVNLATTPTYLVKHYSRSVCKGVSEWDSHLNWQVTFQNVGGSQAITWWP